jgi:mono/diheme cytochrome c family protein
MQQIRGKFATTRRFMALTLVTLFAAVLAHGQTQAFRFNVPFGFTVGSKVLPAGVYKFSTSQDLSALSVESDTSWAARVNILARISGPNEMFKGGYLVFDKADRGLILSEVWISGTDGVLLHSIPKGHERVGVAGTSLDSTRSYSGKAAYNLTCARCHGDNGKGNEDADKFFGLKIPRLTSPDVQAKSDEELRELITQGTTMMPPVEIDESGFRHRLPQQDVEAVVAYVRTLKR